jgi:nicotinate-nucleotide adenylyltransferase
MKERITIGGSAADPPHLGHRILIKCLLQCGKFDKIIWIPSGNRRDKKNLIASDHRVTMTMLTFPKEWFYGEGPVFLINFQNVYGVNRPTLYWLQEVRRENLNAEISWYTGVDSIMPQDGFGGKCEIERKWFNGLRLMKEQRFYILPRGEKYPHPSQIALPPQFEILDEELPDISSTDIRRKIVRGEKFEHLVTPEVAAYIKRFRLYSWPEKEKED